MPTNQCGLGAVIDGTVGDDAGDVPTTDGLIDEEAPSNGVGGPVGVETSDDATDDPSSKSSA